MYIYIYIYQCIYLSVYLSLNIYMQYVLLHDKYIYIDLHFVKNELPYIQNSLKIQAIFLKENRERNIYVYMYMDIYVYI